MPLTQPRHKSCAVTIDSYVVVTGGTSLGLGKFKPQWLAEIGTRKTEMFDGKTFSPLPSMNRAKVRLIYFVSWQGVIRIKLLLHLVSFFIFYDFYR